ncbi:MAG: Crp/Fnr family transcriptional regulator [Ardenticatenales bacterium]
MTRPASELLEKFDLFADRDAGALVAIAAAALTRRVEAGDAFFVQGEPTACFYVLSKGRARLTQVTPDGQQVVVRFITPGEGFGIVASLAGGDYPLTAEALEPAEAYGWDGEAFKGLMAAHPELASRSMALLASRMREFQDRNRELATERVERRIARALLRLAGQSGVRESGGVRIDLPLSRQDLAELSGTTVFTVSRLLSGWEAAGIVGTGRKRIVIRRPHDLVAIAEDLPPATH